MKRRPPDRTKPGGPNVRIQAWVEPKVKEELLRRSREHDWTLSKEIGALIDRALAMSGHAALPSPEVAAARNVASLKQRAHEIELRFNVSPRTALRLARRETEAG